MPLPLIAVEPLLCKRRFGLAHFHLRNVGSKFDSGGRDRGLELFALRFELRLIFVGPDPNKFVLWPIHPGADDGYANLLVQHHYVLFEVLQKIIHLTLIDRVNTDLRNHIAFLLWIATLPKSLAGSQTNIFAPAIS